MADRILGTFYLTASDTGTEIPLPKYSGGEIGAWFSEIYDPLYFYQDSIFYMFTNLHSGSIELISKTDGINLDTVYGTSIPAGILIDASTTSTLGPFKLIAEPPRFLYSSKPSGEPCRVTILLVR